LSALDGGGDKEEENNKTSMMMEDAAIMWQSTCLLRMRGTSWIEVEVTRGDAGWKWEAERM
jgi:hypothetical protein